MSQGDAAHLGAVPERAPVVGTVREDYSDDGDAGVLHPRRVACARSRWGEDGLAGVCDNQQRLCLAVALWNEHDPILKERLFGLTNSEGNHGTREQSSKPGRFNQKSERSPTRTSCTGYDGRLWVHKYHGAPPTATGTLRHPIWLPPLHRGSAGRVASRLPHAGTTNPWPFGLSPTCQGIHHVGLTRIELVTSSLSGMRSNRLSYSPSSGRQG